MIKTLLSRTTQRNGAQPDACHTAAAGSRPGMRALLAGLALSIAAPSHAADLTLYAAGSLRVAMTALIGRFSADTGIRVQPTYGASGLLRERIEKGEAPDIFASANLEHPMALQRQGLLRDAGVFASNHLCLLAAPGVKIDTPHALDLLLDPNMRLATSTPGGDPGGDYTWMMFHKAETLHPGAYATLDAKALHVMGELGADGKPLGVTGVLKQHKAELVIGYCSYARVLEAQVPGATWAHLPPALDVASQYGIGAGAKADPRAQRFLQFVLGKEGQAIMAQNGFNQ